MQENLDDQIAALRRLGVRVYPKTDISLTLELHETYGIPSPFGKGVPDVYERAATSLCK